MSCQDETRILNEALKEVYESKFTFRSVDQIEELRQKFCSTGVGCDDCILHLLVPPDAPIQAKSMGTYDYVDVCDACMYSNNKLEWNFPFTAAFKAEAKPIEVLLAPVEK